MNNMYERSVGLLGETAFKKLQEKTVLVVGLGGVGGTALEALVRSGISKVIIVDFDKISSSNLNRQILYVDENIGEFKVFCAEKRIKQINKNIIVESINAKIDETTIAQLATLKFDFIVDAIDDVNAKVLLSKFALENNKPIIISLGMANRIDPAQVFVTRLDKTTNDPLAKKFRYEIKHAGLDTSKLMVVASKETPIKDANNLHSMMMVPSSAGLSIANYVITYLINN